MSSLETNSIFQDHQSVQARVGGSELRINTYTILASLLHRTPDSQLLNHLSGVESVDSSEPGTMGRAWMALKQAAVEAAPSALAEEYQDLFIGLGRGEVVPFGSWHLTGFLMDKPLSDLRDDLKALGIVRDDDEKDPEDHIAALCETMALLIQADDVDEQMERRFFACHLHPWASKFFKEVQEADSAKFYRHVGYLGQSFMEVESHYLNVRTH
ncbi:MAG: molecular chaperone TorD family protein [Gammaproteobacteria bacterium]|nr:molecular chaperone TorD family protein [Gammaproteobacteria bacterium]